MIEVTRLTKAGGPLTKRISLAPDGTLKSDGSACVMTRGAAERVPMSSLAQFGELIDSLEPNEAIALGTLRPDLPGAVKVMTKDRLEQLNGHAGPDIIARTADHIDYVPRAPALALIDLDTKGMPHAVKARIEALGGFWGALVSVLPPLSDTACVTRRSTSSGISRSDTGAAMPGSNGLHVFVLVRDGGDVERFLRTFHDRCWLASLGWMMAGKAGQLLERSLVDRMVYAPERLVFEGAPVLDAPLVQDRASRAPVVTGGVALDTVADCPPLTLLEQSRLKDLRAKETHRLAPESAKARTSFVAEQAARIAARTGLGHEQAGRIAMEQANGILLPDVVLPFDADEHCGTTVADVLAHQLGHDPAPGVL